MIVELLIDLIKDTQDNEMRTKQVACLDCALYLERNDKKENDFYALTNEFNARTVLDYTLFVLEIEHIELYK